MTEPVHESASHVTDLEAKAVALFAAEIGEYLSLPRYRYNVMIDPCHEDALASIHTVTHRHVAQIYLSKEWMQRSEAERLNTVIHEVCHLLHRDVDFAVRTGDRYVHSWEFDAVWSAYQREVELMVDHLASFIESFSKIQETWVICYSKAEAELAE